MIFLTYFFTSFQINLVLDSLLNCESINLNLKYSGDLLCFILHKKQVFFWKLFKRFNGQLHIFFGRRGGRWIKLDRLDRDGNPRNLKIFEVNPIDPKCMDISPPNPKLSSPSQPTKQIPLSRWNKTIEKKTVDTL